MARLVHPDRDDKQFQAEVALIKGDQPAPVEVGGALDALTGNNRDEGQGDEEPPPAEE
ncbi:hypothetical protein [Micromonospora sp. KC207]|uniref:hypothetical protein n=1 Tax=Micromonospora sp. KC207 TaxID=2530377 RepID=UPI0014053AF2|nr:hypothetical protein [Micromonospora sp. KC207]